MTAHRRLIATLFAVTFAGAVLAGCGSSGGDTSTKTTPTATAHHLRVIYATPTTKSDALAQTLLSAGGTSEVAKGLANDFKLPWDTKVVVRSNSQSGPQFTPDNHTINLDYNFVTFILNKVKEENPKISDYDLGKTVAAINTFIFVHEFAHLLINAFDLPITGREEDAADQLATVFMTEFVGKAGKEYALDAAQFFDSLAQNPSDLKAADFFDEHSLSEQRAGSIICWVAGSDQNVYNAIEKSGVLGDRLARCPDEYKQIVHSWKTLIRPHLSSTGKRS